MYIAAGVGRALRLRGGVAECRSARPVTMLGSMCGFFAQQAQMRLCPARKAVSSRCPPPPWYRCALLHRRHRQLHPQTVVCGRRFASPPWGRFRCRCRCCCRTGCRCSRSCRSRRCTSRTRCCRCRCRRCRPAVEQAVLVLAVVILVPVGAGAHASVMVHILPLAVATDLRR